MKRRRVDARLGKRKRAVPRRVRDRRTGRDTVDVKEQSVPRRSGRGRRGICRKQLRIGRRSRRPRCACRARGTRRARDARCARRTRCPYGSCSTRGASGAGAIWELFCILFAVFRERLVRYKFIIDMNVPRLVAIRLFADGDKLDELQAHFARKLFAPAVAFKAGYVFLGIRLYGIRLGKPLFKFGNALLRAFLLRLVFPAQISAHAFREIAQHFFFKSRLNELIQLSKPVVE